MLYYRKNGSALPLDWEDYAIQEELFGAEDTLTFTLPPEHPQLHDMTPLLELTDKDSGQRYLITAMDEGDVTARLDTDALKATLWPVYSNHSDTPAGTVSGALPSGWLCIDHTARTDKKTLALEGVTPLDVLRETADKFGVGIRIGTESCKVELFDRRADTASGAYFSEELNLLRRPVRSAKAEDFATRLYAYGKDGMTFADINDGKEYVEDHSWSDRVICAYWKDERYTIKENLLADAKAKLAAMAAPAVSYECSVADLARIDPQRWGQLSVPLYSAVILMDRARGTRTVHHVARIKRWPHHPEKNVVTLSTVPGTLRGKVEQTWTAVSDPNSDFRQLQQAAVDSATAQITGNKGGYVVMHSSTGAKEPDEVLIMDTPDIATATRVWRWNKSGLGYSSTGYNGPYGLAMTQDGAIVADFITTGTLNAALIKAGVLQDKTGKVFKLDLDGGTLDADFSSLKIAGRSAEEIAQEKADTVSKDLSDYKAAVQKTVDDLQGQIDGSITTWFYPYDPAPDNLPASGWASDAEKENHAGDLFYNTGTGKAYRWALVGGLWRWLLIEDTDVTKALASAQKAQDTADGKRRNFLTQPQPPYDAGDLWSQQTGELLVCKTAKAAGAAFDASDWTGAADYSAQAGEAAAEKINAITQQDIFNKLTNNGAMKGLYMQDGNLYINADYIQSGTLRAGLVSASSDGGSVILSNGAVYVRDQNGYNRFVMFYDAASGNCIFRMRDNAGEWCGDIVGYRDNDLGIVQMNLSSNGFFRTARIQTGEIAVENGKMFSDMYRDRAGNSFCYKDGNYRVGCFEKLAIGGSGSLNVEWKWDASLSRFVLCAYE